MQSVTTHAEFDAIHAAFAAAMAEFRLPTNARIAVAVSGGADSLALAHLLSAWAKPRGIHLSALTVDHALRDAAAAEAAQVAAWLAPLGVPHTTLRWEEGAQLRGLVRSAQKDAREARYRLMTDWCAANACTHLFVAHHADDQVETFLLRLARGSGVDGLAAMAPAVLRGGIVIARPLLAFAKDQLTAFCRAIGQPWLEDPSNANPLSARVRFRDSRALLEREGLTQERLLATIGHLQRARAALDHAVEALLSAACTWDDYGVAALNIAAFRAAPAEIALRALSRVLTAASGQTYGPRFENLTRVHDCLNAGPWRDATLHGCLLTRDGDVLRVMRESAQIDDVAALSSGQSVVWDGRFRLSLPATAGAADVLTVRRLTDDLLRSLAESVAASDINGVPARVRETLPALFDARGLLAVPHAGYVRDAATPARGLVVACISGRHFASTPGDAEL